MNVRERTQQIEEQTLSPYAALSRNTKGRDRPEEEDVYKRQEYGINSALSNAEKQVHPV